MSNDPEVEAAWMRRVKRGDSEAFALLVDRYRQSLLNLCFRVLGDATEAEDVAQAAFVQVFKHAGRYREGARFSTWLYTIGRNLCLNELRRRSRHPADSMDAGSGASVDSAPPQWEDKGNAPPPVELLRQELGRKVHEAVQALPPNQRMAVLLCRDEDLSYDDIARVLGCSLSATKSLIHRGRETLKKRLKPYLNTGEWDPDEGGEQL